MDNKHTKDSEHYLVLQWNLGTLKRNNLVSTYVGMWGRCNVKNLKETRRKVAYAYKAQK
jgi:hypothetical protein